MAKLYKCSLAGFCHKACACRKRHVAQKKCCQYRVCKTTGGVVICLSDKGIRQI